MRHLCKLYSRSLLLYVGIMLSILAHAQQLHFIYIQADTKQPFSVKLNGKYYSSSAIGYLILPKLTDGTYTLEVNFAKNSYPEQTFTVNIAGKDYGYGLKQFDEKGWGLFNFQTTDVVMSTAATSSQTSQANVTTNNSAFGNMLAEVINDKSINTLTTNDTVVTRKKENETAAASFTFSDTVPAVVADAKTDTAPQDAMSPDNATARATGTAISTEAEDTPETESPAYNTTGVIKAAENIDEKGTDLTFIDFNGFYNDTIKAFIPAEEKKLSDKTKAPEINDKAAAADSANGKVDNPFFTKKYGTATAADNAPATAASSRVTGDTPAAPGIPANNAVLNTGCANMLSEGDLSKLKKRIIAEADQYAILQSVKKSLKNKCVTTAQVKDLGNLFLNDDNRYGFYDAVYPFVYDYSNYASLQSTLLDPYYKSRFKALLR